MADNNADNKSQDTAGAAGSSQNSSAATAIRRTDRQWQHGIKRLGEPRSSPPRHERLFEIIADPTMHHVIDGSGTVRNATGEPRLLSKGDKFSTNMRLFVPYRMRNTVVEYDRDRLIAWAHIGGWRWRYELEPVEVDGIKGQATKVTETFDWSTSKAGFYVTMMGWNERNRQALEKTLGRLDTFVSNTGQGL
ncbi:MAG: hypothetical protein V9F03_16680 [Microthrixaceae bacterium]